MNIDPIKELIKKKCGLVFEVERTKLLERAVESRMIDIEVNSSEKYLNYLIAREEEFSNLITHITINETYFFREPEHIKLTSDVLIPEILKTKQGKGHIRILNAGCSTGEESYSIAIAIMEKYKTINFPLSVIGIDIDNNVINKAISGIYEKLSFRSIKENISDKYFDPLPNNRFAIKENIKKMVEFKNFNLLNTNYPDYLKNMDIIFYRNVSIYFDNNSKKNIFQSLADALNQNGYLFVGKAETIFHNLNILSLVQIDGNFLFKKKCDESFNKNNSHKNIEKAIIKKNKDSNTKAFDKKVIKKNYPIVSTVSDLKSEQNYEDLFNEAMTFAKEKKYSNALNYIKKILDNNKFHIMAHILKANIMLNLQNFDEATKICLQILDIDNLNLESYLLLGLIAKNRNDIETAIKRFREAIYIETSCWLAHYSMAELYSIKGDNEKAYREYSIVIKLLDKGNITQNQGLLFQLAFKTDHLIYLCKTNMDKLKLRLT
ncbi:MAG: hypothetical protein HQK76_17895 [Desulfobacterales bacterium]|nr:hypothetical protein [Desulfobacterales bacterium]